MRAALGLVALSLAAACARADEGAPAAGATVALGGGRQPQIAVAPSGAIDVVFARGTSVFWSRSVDGGARFAEATAVGERADLKVGLRRGPRVAASGERLVVTAPGRDLVAWISDDGGRRWSSPLAVNDAPGAAGEGLHNLTALPDGGFFAVWLDARTGKGARIEGARLERGAHAWSANVEIYAPPAGGVCPCCHPSVAVGRDGTIAVLFRNDLANDRDPWLATSRDGGRSFAPAVRLGGASWNLDACPMDGGGVIVDADGAPRAIWRRERDILLLGAGRAETRVGAGTQPVLAAWQGGLLLAWQEGSRVVVRRADRDGALRTLPGRFPALAASPDGTRGYLVLEAPRAAGTAVEFVALP